jgi:hypothetical protein
MSKEGYDLIGLGMVMVFWLLVCYGGDILDAIRKRK